MKNLFSLKGKSALVTGATGYLGRSLVEGLAKSGAVVYVNGRDVQKVNSLISSLNKDSITLRPAIFDVTKENEIQKFFSSFKSKALDIIVNNAYAGGPGSIETANASDYIKSYEVTQISSHNIVQKALPYLRCAVKNNGYASVINIASMYGVISPDHRIYGAKNACNPPFYGAAKAALIQWSRYAACEFAQEGIRFNSISPGPFPSTDVIESNNNLIDKIKIKVPMGRVGNPTELIGPVVFLASPSSSFVTGINIPVDGGWTAW